MTTTARNPVASPATPTAAHLPRGYYLGAALAPILLLAAWGVLLLARATPVAPAQIGDPAPAFVLADLDGNPVRLAELRGRPVIVNFWASWCGPCVEEFPLLTDAATAHRADGLVVVGIVYQDRSEAAREFVGRMGATWTAAMDPGDRVAARYGIVGPPDTFFIDRSGRIAARQIGQLSAADMQAGLSQILEGER